MRRNVWEENLSDRQNLVLLRFYSDKYAKIGFQVSELFDDELLKEKVVRVAEQKNVILEHLYHKPLIDTDELLNTLHEYRDMVAPYVCDVSLFLDKALKEGKTVLLEGQLGTLKRSGSRNLSNGYLIFHTGCIRCNRGRSSAI